MRTVLAILIVAVIALAIAVGTGLIDIRQTRPADLPDVTVSEDGVSASGGRQPAFDVETGSIAVGSETRAVTVPTLEVQSANGNDVAPDAAE